MRQKQNEKSTDNEKGVSEEFDIAVKSPLHKTDEVKLQRIECLYALSRGLGEIRS